MKMNNNLYNIKNVTDLDAFENVDKITDEALLTQLEMLFNTPINKISDVHPFLLRWILNKLEEMNRLTDNFTGPLLNSTTKDNLYNFALAKQSTFLNSVKMIKKSKLEAATETEKLKKFANLTFNTQQKVEEEQVKHNTQMVEKVYREGSRNMLRYVSEGDNRVRDEHQKADGITLPADHRDWNKLFNLLGEWNCRCEIVPVEDDEEMKLPPKNLVTPTSTQVPTDINLDVQEGKVIIFKEELDVFKKQPGVVRKMYRRNGF